MIRLRLRLRLRRCNYIESLSGIETIAAHGYGVQVARVATI